MAIMPCTHPFDGSIPWPAGVHGLQQVVPPRRQGLCHVTAHPRELREAEEGDGGTDHNTIHSQQYKQHTDNNMSLQKMPSHADQKTPPTLQNCGHSSN
eukprot:1159597-Pelagomonas_calceolata.AAC.7